MNKIEPASKLPDYYKEKYSPKEGTGIYVLFGDWAVEVEYIEKVIVPVWNGEE